jgi:hypothetical protein
VFEPLGELSLRLRGASFACKNVAAHIQAGETEHNHSSGEKCEHGTPPPFHWLALAIANVFFAQIFRPGPGKQSAATDEKKPSDNVQLPQHRDGLDLLKTFEPQSIAHATFIGITARANYSNCKQGCFTKSEKRSSH